MPQQHPNLTGLFVQYGLPALAPAFGIAYLLLNRRYSPIERIIVEPLPRTAVDNFIRQQLLYSLGNRFDKVDNRLKKLEAHNGLVVDDDDKYNEHTDSLQPDVNWKDDRRSAYKFNSEYNFPP